MDALIALAFLSGVALATFGLLIDFARGRK